MKRQDGKAEERIIVVMENGRLHITDGRHRVCAAHQPGVLDLLGWMEV